MSHKIKVGVFGGRRGQSMIDVLSRHPDAELVAVCESAEPALRQCLAQAERAGAKVTGYADFDRFLEHDMDAVVVANYATEHTPYAIRALDSGRHVSSEIPACQTLAEAVALVEAVERSGKVYSFAENCCFFRGVMEMQRLYQRGDIGEFLHGEGEYIHDGESIWPDITYGQRDHWRNWVSSTFYCTHSLGPIMTITGTRPTRVSAYETLNYNKQRFGAQGADGSVLVCQMNTGATAVILPWCSFKRHPASHWYVVYGSTGTIETDRWGSTFNNINVYREGDPLTARETHYVPNVALETELGNISGGHGGADFYTMHFFLDAILDRPGKAYNIDVYQGLDMTLPGLLGYRSIWEGNVPLEVPNLREKTIRDRYRDDTWSLDPALAGPGQPDASCAAERVTIPDEIYEKQAEAYRKIVGG